jgi:anti-sigma regulatory factor (Ser/Thr protein kinase)
VSRDDGVLHRLSEVALSDERERADRILAIARDTLGMQIAYFSQFNAGEQVIQRVAGDGGSLDLSDGKRVPLADTFCRRMLNEEVSPVIPDSREEPALQESPGTQDSPVIAYVGVPLQLSTGRVYGTLCCASDQPRQELDERDLAFMHVLARMLSDLLEHPPPVEPGWEEDTRVDVDSHGQVARLGLWVVATPRAVVAARRALDCLAEWVPEQRMNDLQLAIGELVTNAIRHAGLGTANAVGVDVSVDAGRLCGEVTDPGKGFDPAELAGPTAGRAGGWGLHIVEQLSERWGVDESPTGGARVWFELSL